MEDVGNLRNINAYQKQPQIFINPKPNAPKKKKLRWVRNLRCGVKTPREAKEGTYIDKKCPFTGTVVIKGRLFRGIVYKMKMMRTIVVRREYLHYVSKYNRFEKRHKHYSAHCSPCFKDIDVGDTVIIGETRRLSNFVHFNVVKVIKNPAIAKKAFKKF